MVESQPSKLLVASSILVSRSIYFIRTPRAIAATRARFDFLGCDEIILRSSAYRRIETGAPSTSGKRPSA